MLGGWVWGTDYHGVVLCTLAYGGPTKWRTTNRCILTVEVGRIKGRDTVTKCQHCSNFGPDCACGTPAGVMSKIKYRDRKIYVDPEGTYLQVQGDGWTGRKWTLSKHMTVSELVQTAFMACLAWEEHECREEFRYKGQAVFGPHFHVEALVKLCEQGQLQYRAAVPQADGVS